MILHNRKKCATAGHFVPLPLIALVVLAPTLSIGYLWLGARCEAIGKELKVIDADLNELHRKCLYEESRWMKTKSPAEIDKALRRHHLEMSWPSERQIVRVNSADVNEALAQGYRESHARYAQVHRVGMND